MINSGTLMKRLIVGLGLFFTSVAPVTANHLRWLTLPFRQRDVSSQYHVVTQCYSATHVGIDFGIVNDPPHIPVVAADNGTVSAFFNQIEDGQGTGAGNYIYIDHSQSGLQTRYLHLSRINWVAPPVGQPVTQGQTLAWWDDTGTSSANHLHFEVRNLSDLTQTYDPYSSTAYRWATNMGSCVTQSTAVVPHPPTYSSYPYGWGWAASSSHWNRYGDSPDNLTNAWDRNTSTRWSTTDVQRPGMWFKLDLGEVELISGIRLLSQNLDYPRGYTVEVSTDNVNWTQVASGTGTSDDITITWSPARNARWIRINQTGSSPDHWWSIHEIWARRPSTGLEASSNYNDRESGSGDLLQYAFDDNTSTYWSTETAQVPNMEFRLDLGLVYTKSRITFTSGGRTNDYPAQYRIDVSTDEITWVNVVPTTNGTGPVVDHTFPARSVRYVRIIQSGSKIYWWSIQEIDVL